VGCLRRRSSSGADQAKGVPACFVSVRAAAKQRRLRAKGGVSAFAPTNISPIKSQIPSHCIKKYTFHINTY
jgi:hypothetical protein